MADKAAPPNLMGYLFSRDVLLQSLRLGLAGAWDVTHPEVVEGLRQLELHCPVLIKSFLPRGERDLKDIEDDEDQEQDQDQDQDQPDQQYVVDPEHVSISLSVRGFDLDRGNFYRIGAAVRLNNLKLPHPFLTQLNEAYYRDFGLRNVMDFSNKPLKWHKRIAYTDP